MTPVVPIPSSTEASPARRIRQVRRVLFAVVAALTLAATLTVGALLAWDAGYGGRVLPGVAIGGVDLGGLDHDAAAAVLATALPYGEGRLVLRTPDGDVEIPYKAFRRRPEIHAMADAALQSGRDGTVVDRVFGQVRQALQGVTLESRVGNDVDALRAAVRLAVVRLIRAPVDATIVAGPDGPVTSSSATGRAVDVEPVVAAALAAMSDANAPAVVVVPVPVTSVPPTVNDDAVALAIARTQRLDWNLVITDGGKTWTLAAEVVRGWVQYRTQADGSIGTVINATLIPEALKSVAKGVAKAPVSASFRFNGTRVTVGKTPAADGRRLDVEATAARVAQELETRPVTGERRPVDAVVTRIAPKITNQEAAEVAPQMKVLGSWRTWFPISERNFYGANIWRPAQLINGTVIPPGGKFDWWRAILPVTEARGFGPGGVIRPDRTDPTGALGGGMCSSSTTLFNAALRAGLKIDERHNHRYYITRYPLGLDATVSLSGSSRVNLKFTNDTANPILIRGMKIRDAGGRGWVKYQIWGVPDGRTVSIGKPVIRNILRATTKTVYVDTLPRGVKVQVEYPSDRMDVSRTRVVRDANGRVIHKETWRSRYVLWNGRIEVGR